MFHRSLTADLESDSERNTGKVGRISDCENMDFSVISSQYCGQKIAGKPDFAGFLRMWTLKGGFGVQFCYI